MASTAIFLVMMLIVIAHAAMVGSAGGIRAARGTTAAAAPGSAGVTTTAAAGISISPSSSFHFHQKKKELALLLADQLDYGGSSNCSSFECMECLLETIGSCLSHLWTCVTPATMVECFVGKFVIIEDCLGELTAVAGSASAAAGGRSISAAGELTTPTPAAPAPAPAAGSVSALLRQEIALADLGNSCSDDNCKQCLLHNIWSCTFDAALCVDPWEFLRCLVEKFIAFKKCFGA